MGTLKNKPFLIIALFLGGFIILNQISTALMSALAVDGSIATDTYLLIGVGFRIVYTLVSFWLIKTLDLLSLAGLDKSKLKDWLLLLFPLYLLVITAPDPGEFDFASISMFKYGILLLYVVSIGFSEEFMLRGFLQSFLLKHFGQSKKKIVLSVIFGAFLFGILHLLKFDKGIYGEISQVFYATFIGTMFGALLLRINKIWPLILLHALIDFINNFDIIVNETRSLENAVNHVSLENAIIVTLAVLPCFIYGLFILRKVEVLDIEAKL